MAATPTLNEATTIAGNHRPVGGMAPSYRVRHLSTAAVTQRVGAGHARDRAGERSHRHHPEPPPCRGHGPLLQGHPSPRPSHNV